MYTVTSSLSNITEMAATLLTSLAGSGGLKETGAKMIHFRAGEEV